MLGLKFGLSFKKETTQKLGTKKKMSPTLTLETIILLKTTLSLYYTTPTSSCRVLGGVHFGCAVGIRRLHSQVSKMYIM